MTGLYAERVYAKHSSGERIRDKTFQKEVKIFKFDSFLT
jgi:hypothetical protein